jgi:hypothetical protein
VRFGAIVGVHRAGPVAYLGASGTAPWGTAAKILPVGVGGHAKGAEGERRVHDD